MGLSWQQGPASPTALGRFLTAQPLPERLLFSEPLRRRMRVKFGGEWVADSEDIVLLHEPGRYPVAYFPLDAVHPEVLEALGRTTQHRDLGETSWFAVKVGERRAERAAWQFTGLPEYAAEFKGRVAFAWRAMDAFYEENERILGHAADPYHRIDIRNTSRVLEVRAGGELVARSTSPVVLYESGFAPRWYVPREDIQEAYLTPIEGQTFCPYKGLASYYDIEGAPRAAWSYRDAYEEVGRVSDLVSFEPDKVEVYIDGEQLSLEPGQQVIPHGIDRGLGADEVLSR
ncbi:DUF427 domain-containing protein [Streptomyces sp. Lzd4kr]|nr:DUF427 domain-containing protein [Streptomyces sp. Lzd4kr]